MAVYFTKGLLMQQSRLFKIVYHLLNEGQTSAPELAKMLEVSVRTIYRDIDALSSAGVPVYAQAGKNGGVHLMPGFILDKAVFSQQEKQEILTALQSLNAAQGMQYQEVLSKLCAVFNVSAENWLEVDFARWGDHKSDNQKFELLKNAVIQHQAVIIQYAGGYQHTCERKIYPLKLCYKSRAWYLKAYCTQRKGFRLFKLTRILGCAVTDDHFSGYTFPPQPDVPPPEYDTVTLQFPPEMAYRVYDEFEGAQVQRQQNGDLIVRAALPQDGWLVGFVLSFAAQVTVLSPPSLKQAVAEQAKLIYQKNQP